jgi:hypothetical protein
MEDGISNGAGDFITGFARNGDTDTERGKIGAGFYMGHYEGIFVASGARANV